MIDYILLTDTFGHWVVTTNEIIDELNREVLNDLQTSDKSSLVAAINELYNTKYDKTGGTISGNVNVTGNTSVEGTISIGKNTGGNSILYFYDDNANVYRELLWDASALAWKIRDKNNVLQNVFHSGLNINLGTLSGLVGDTQIQFKGGTTAENDAYTGAIKEITVDTEAGSLRLHDGVTPGGTVISGGGGGGPTAVDTLVLGTNFSAGSTVLPLSMAPADVNHTRLMMNGLQQARNTYTVSGSTIVLSSGVVTGVTIIEVEIFG